MSSSAPASPPSAGSALSMTAFDRAKQSFLERHEADEQVDNKERDDEARDNEPSLHDDEQLYDDLIIYLSDDDNTNHNSSIAGKNTPPRPPGRSAAPLSRSAAPLSRSAAPLSRSTNNIFEDLPTPTAMRANAMRQSLPFSPSATAPERLTTEGCMEERMGDLAASLNFRAEESRFMACDIYDGIEATSAEATHANDEANDSAHDDLLELALQFFRELENEVEAATEAAPDSKPTGSFKWPVFDMASYEHSTKLDWSSFPSPANPNLSNVVIVNGMPSYKSSEREKLISLFSQCLFPNKVVVSLYFPESEDAHTLQRCFKGVVFVEFDSPTSARLAERDLDGQPSPFATSGKLGCRRFQHYEGAAVDTSIVEGGEREEEEEEGEKPLMDVDAAIAMALAPLEKYQHSKEMDERLVAERDRSASQYAVGAAAIAAMRTGFKRRNRGGGGTVAAEVAGFECALEDAVVKGWGRRVARAEERICGVYGDIVGEEGEDEEGGGVFGRGGTLQMVLGMLSKEEDGGQLEEEGESSQEEEEDMPAEMLMKREVERNLWRRCLQGERLRSAALLRRMTTLQRGKFEDAKEVRKLRRQLSTAHEGIQQLSHVRDALTRQNEAQGERLGAQREAIARLGRFQRMCEASEERARHLIEQRERLEGEREELSTKLEELQKRKGGAGWALEEDDSGGEEEGGRGGGGEKEAVKKFLLAARELREALPSTGEALLKELEETAGDSLRSVRVRREELQKAEEEVRRREKERGLCCVCLVGERSTLLLPCRHLVLCGRCSKDSRMEDCPVCRCKIEDRMDVFAG